LDASISLAVDPANFLKDLQVKKIGMYVTYEKTFLAARLIASQLETLSTLITGSIPQMAMSLMEGADASISNDIAKPVDQNSLV
jgi:hypothetical protein